MPKKYTVFFKCPAHHHTSKVEVVGDFNNWQPGSLILEDNDGDNVWMGMIQLSSGRYQYKFLVDGEYQIDMLNPLTVQDNGHTNSLLLVGEAKLREEFLHQSQNIDYYNERTFYIRAQFSHQKYRAGRIIMVIDDVNYTTPGYELYNDEIYAYYLFKVQNVFKASNILYYFELEDRKGKLHYFGKNGEANSEWEVEEFEISKQSDEIFITPEWVKDAVFYQIFPERFYNGDASLNPIKVEDPDTPPKWDTFYGGDLPGVIEKLDYLKELGINAVYFNPLFESSSTHKYDTNDYLKIDPHFGNEQVFNQLVYEFNRRGIRFILDGVFNHTGTGFFAFKDIQENKEKSQYKDWYFIRKFPLMENGKPNYECWWNFPNMPKVNLDHPSARQYFLNVAKLWIERGASGWRLDVPNMIDHKYWKEFRKLVKSVNPEAYIVGEIWHNAQDWLEGDEFDAVMNYRFRDACVEFFAHRRYSAEEFVRQVGSQIFDYPMQANFAMMNLLSSHDTARYFTVADKSISRVILSIAFQFTYLGAPSIYYGDEIGMEGGKDPDNRRFMIWDKQKWKHEILECYRSLIRIRNQNPVLRRGDIRFFYAQNMVVGFERFTESERLWVWINNSDVNVNIDITSYAGNGDFVDIYKDCPLKRKRAYTLYANDFAILKKVRERK